MWGPCRGESGKRRPTKVAATDPDKTGGVADPAVLPLRAGLHLPPRQRDHVYVWTDYPR